MIVNENIKNTYSSKYKEKEQHKFDVIGVGLGRTGTRSLKQALDILGFKTYHGFMVFYPELDLNAVNFYINAVKLKLDNKENEINFDEMFKGFNAGLDINIATFYKELYKRNPDVKVILTIRELDSWYNSFFKTLYTSDIENRNFEGFEKVCEMFDLLYYNTLFQGKFENKEFTIKIHLDHIEEVKKTIPKKNLLIFDVKQGWEPLCKFFDVEIPNIEFPKSNDTKTFLERVKERKLDLNNKSFDNCSRKSNNLSSCSSYN